MLVRRMLHIGSSSSQGTEFEGGEELVHYPSVSLRRVWIDVDENDKMVARNSCQMIENASEGGESDDVFPLVHDDPSKSLANFQFSKPKSSTIGRELIASTSVIDLSQLEDSKSVTLRRQLPLERIPIIRSRAARSTVYHFNDEQVTSCSERTMSEEINHFQSMGTVKSFQSRETDLKKRRDAMKRRSTRDLEHSSCSIRMYTMASTEGDTVGWSEVKECTSMLTIWIELHVHSKKILQCMHVHRLYDSG